MESKIGTGKSFSGLASLKSEKLNAICSKCKGSDFRHVIGSIYICTFCHGVLDYGIDASKADNV